MGKVRSILATFLACISLQSFAAGSITAKVLAIRVDQTGNGMVIFDQNVGGSPPGCVTSTYQKALAFNTNTSAGKAIYAMALSAKAMDSTITANGLGSCSVFGSYVEDWDYGVLQ